jgi:hypothetical protein
MTKTAIVLIKSYDQTEELHKAGLDGVVVIRPSDDEKYYDLKKLHHSPSLLVSICGSVRVRAVGKFAYFDLPLIAEIPKEYVKASKKRKLTVYKTEADIPAEVSYGAI